MHLTVLSFSNLFTLDFNLHCDIFILRPPHSATSSSCNRLIQLRHTTALISSSALHPTASLSLHQPTSFSALLTHAFRRRLPCLFRLRRLIGRTSCTVRAVTPSITCLFFSELHRSHIISDVYGWTESAVPVNQLPGSRWHSPSTQRRVSEFERLQEESRGASEREEDHQKEEKVQHAVCLVSLSSISGTRYSLSAVSGCKWLSKALLSIHDWAGTQHVREADRACLG